MNRASLLLLFLLFLVAKSEAQTQPQPFDLSTGNFLFDTWDSLAPAQTYPSNMMFHRVDNANPSDMDTATGDWGCVYNLNAGCAIKGKGANGVSFRNINTAQTDNCVPGGPTNNGRYVGIAVVGLNTLSRQNIQVSWVGRMLSAFVYNNPAPGSPGNPVNRFYGIKCQYRLGQSGAFTDLPADSIFYCNANDSTYHPQFYADSIGPVVLPGLCENQPLVQIRWIYFQYNSGAGPRPELGVDDIVITSDISTSITPDAVITKRNIIRENPVADKILRLFDNGRYTIVNMLGQQETFFSGNEVNLGDLPAGLYFLRNSKGETERFILQ